MIKFFWLAKKESNKLVKIFFRDIVNMEARTEYLMLYFTHQQVITHMTMKAMEDVLPSLDFIRIHRSYHISKREVTGMASSFLEVAGKKLPIGETYKLNLWHAFKTGA